jgi:predicted RND superfamily exporter protein
LTEEYLDQVRGLAEDLRQLERRTTQDRLTKVVSITDGLDLIPERILFTRLSLETRLGLLSGIQSEFTSSLYNPEAGRMRIMLRAMERQPSETKLKLIEDVEALARKRFPDASATGLFVLLTFIIESLMSDQLTSSVLAGVALTIQMSVAFRSLRIGLISLIPNIFPILLVIGTMGWIGLPVDSSVHYITSYHAARRRGASVSNALEATNQGVGLALVFANVALVAGFSVLTLSHFIPLVYFGILVSVSMLGGLFGNLVLLPLLLRMVDANPRGSSEPAAVGDV